MSLISLMAASLSNIHGINNAENLWRQNSMENVASIRKAANPNLGFAGLDAMRRAENERMTSNLLAGLERQALIAMEKPLKQMTKDSIKRNFDVFA